MWIYLFSVLNLGICALRFHYICIDLYVTKSLPYNLTTELYVYTLHFWSCRCRLNNNQEGCQKLSPTFLAEVVGNAVCNVIENKVFARNLRSELSRYSYQQLDEESDESSGVKTIYEGYPILHWTF